MVAHQHVYAADVDVRLTKRSAFCWLESLDRDFFRRICRPWLRSTTPIFSQNLQSNYLEVYLTMAGRCPEFGVQTWVVGYLETACFLKINFRERVYARPNCARKGRKDVPCCNIWRSTRVRDVVFFLSVFMGLLVDVASEWFYETSWFCTLTTSSPLVHITSRFEMHAVKFRKL